METVLPNLVRTVHHPAELDSLGNVLHPDMEVKTVNYNALIPISIAAIKEQQGTILTLQSQVAELIGTLAAVQEQLAACCAAPTDADQRNRMQETGTVEGLERNLLINPNPFVGQTMLTYTLDRSGAVSLMANSADGKQLHALVQANMEAGQYQFEWNTADLAPGIYYVTLLLDGEPIVKKAVKVQR